MFWRPSSKVDWWWGRTLAITGLFLRIAINISSQQIKATKSSGFP
jgi:hypothetical protein